MNHSYKLSSLWSKLKSAEEHKPVLHEDNTTAVKLSLCVQVNILCYITWQWHHQLSVTSRLLCHSAGCSTGKYVSQMNHSSLPSAPMTPSSFQHHLLHLHVNLISTWEAQTLGSSVSPSCLWWCRNRPSGSCCRSHGDPCDATSWQHWAAGRWGSPCPGRRCRGRCREPAGETNSQWVQDQSQSWKLKVNQRSFTCSNMWMKRVSACCILFVLSSAHEFYFYVPTLVFVLCWKKLTKKLNYKKTCWWVNEEKQTLQHLHLHQLVCSNSKRKLHELQQCWIHSAVGPFHELNHSEINKQKNWWRSDTRQTSALKQTDSNMATPFAPMFPLGVTPSPPIRPAHRSLKHRTPLQYFNSLCGKKK